MTKRSGIVAHVIIYLFVIVCLAPFAWLIWTSLKASAQAYTIPPVWFFKPNFDSYVSAWTSGGMGGALGNSAIVAVGSSVIGAICGVPLAYAITQIFPSWSRRANRVAMLILLLTVIPPALSLVPLYRELFSLHLTQGVFGLLIVHSFYATLLVVLILRSFLLEFPREIREAALIDGATEVRVLFSCVLPNVLGALVAIFILAIIQSWNEYFYALVLLTGDSKTAPVAISSFLSFYGTNWAQLTAASVIAIAPILIFAMSVRKYLARGLTFGGVK